VAQKAPQAATAPPSEGGAMNFDVYTMIARPDRTVSVLLAKGAFVCFLMEDAVREVAGQPVAQWKVPGQTAIPAGTYPFYLADSPRFGADAITIEPVPGFLGIRVHANAKSDYVSHRSTEGCPIPGMRLVALDDGDLRLTDDETAHARVQDMLLALRARGEHALITFHRGGTP
jgi:hypothetical protein